MNKIYKVIWSKAKNMWVVASELAKSHTKSPKSGIVGYASLASLESKINMDLSKGFVAGVFPVVNTPAVKSSDFKITVAAIVKNEAENVPTWIQAARSCADEIVVVDTGSTDGTVERFADYGIKCFHYDWNDDFASAKNYMISLCHGDWIVLLDGDEWFREGCDVRKAIAKHHANPITKAIIADWICLDKDRNNAVMFSGGAVRAFRNQPDVRYFRRVHENLTIGYENFAFEPEFKMYHTGYSGSVNRSKHERNLRIMRTMFDFDNGKVEYPTDWRYIEDTYAGLGQFDKALWAADKMILYGVQEYSAAAWITKFNVLFAMKTPLTEMKKQFEYCFQTVPSVSGFRFLASIYYFRNGQIEAGLDNYIEGLRMLMGPQDKVAMEHTYWRMYMPEASALASAVYLRNKQIEASLYACKVCEQYCGQTDWTNGALADVRLVMNQTEEGLLGNISERVLPVLQFGKKVVLATAIASSLTVGMVGVANPVYAACCNLNGDSDNYTTGQNSTVTGGRGNEASGNASSVSGGQCNIASCGSSSVSGGRGNEASGGYSSVSGGSLNEANGDNSTVSGGFHNLASGDASTVSGGSENEAIGTGSSVFGGWNGKAYATYSTVIGGGVAGVLNPNFNPDNSDDSGWSTNPQNYQYLGIGSVAIGKCATTTRDYEIAIGSACAPVKIDGALTVDGAKTVTDGTTTKTWTELLNASGGSNGGGSIPYIGICSTTGFDNENGDGAVGPDSIAIGTSAYASVQDAVAIGTAANASTLYSVAIGREAKTALGSQNVAIGYKTSALGGMVIGGNSSTGNSSTNAMANNSICVGYYNILQDSYSINLGSSNTVTGTSNNSNNIVLGMGRTLTNGSNDVLIGQGSIGDGINNSVVIGTAKIEAGDGVPATIPDNWTVLQEGRFYYDENGLLRCAGTSAGGFAIGYNAQIGGNSPNSSAIGPTSKVGHDSSAALAIRGTVGNHTAVGVSIGDAGTLVDDGSMYSVALGSTARVAADRSVALGAASVATEDDVISVGHKLGDTNYKGDAYDADLNRRITNVADGVNDSDVATVGQLNAQKVEYVGTNVVWKDWVDLTDEEKTALNVTTEAEYDALVAGSNRNGEGAIGINSVAIGVCAVSGSVDSSTGVMQNNTVAIGYNAKAVNYQDIAIGDNASTVGSGNKAVAIGADSQATNSYATALGYDTEAKGTGSVALGKGAVASSDASFAIGYDAKADAGRAMALGKDSHAQKSGAIAFGQDADANGIESIAIGYKANTTASDAIAMGYCSLGSGSESIAIGDTAKAQGASSTAIGLFAVATGQDSITFGTSSKATELGSEALGYVAEATAQNATAVGYNAKARGADSVSLGSNSNVVNANGVGIGIGTVTDAGVYGNRGVAIGFASSVNGLSGIALGDSAKARANNSIALGSCTNSTSLNSVAIGTEISSTSMNSIALGTNTEELVNSSRPVRGALASNSIAIGNNPVSSGSSAISMGTCSHATCNNAIAIGNQSSASTLDSIAIGTMSDSSSNGGIAIGYMSKNNLAGGLSLGNYSKAGEHSVALGNESNAGYVDGATNIADAYSLATAVGYGSTATNAAATALGAESSATGEQSVAVGILSNASGNRSIAIGLSANVSGEDSISIGHANRVNGDHSGAIGDPTIIDGDNSYSVGNNNKVASDTTDVFVFGNSVNTIASDVVVLGKESVGSEAGTISVGHKATDLDVNGQAYGTALNRKIVNVDAGVNDTDAVNVKQLNDQKVEYVGVNAIWKDWADLTSAEKTALGVTTEAEYDEVVAGSNRNGEGAVGDNTIAIGRNASTSSYDSIAIGTNALANGNENVIIGGNASSVKSGSNATRAVAIGECSVVYGSGAVAMGYKSSANGSAVAIGQEAVADGYDGTAVGYLAKAECYASSAFGYLADAKKDISTALGYSSAACDTGSTAVGGYSKAEGRYASALGYNSQSKGYGSVALGLDSEATTDYSIAIGKTNAYGGCSIVIGYCSITTVDASRATVLGYSASAKAEDGLALGPYAQVYANANRGIAIGNLAQVGTYANGGCADSIAIGSCSKVTGQSSIALGTCATATCNSAIALGSNSVANEANVLSLGKEAVGTEGQDGYVPEYTRTIQHVTAGVNDTDAVNVSQLTIGLDEKANVALDNIADAGKTVIQNATNVVSGDSVIGVTSTTENGVKTYTISANVNPDGTIASGNTGLVSGGTVYNEVRPSADGNYIAINNTVGANLTALDTQVKANTDAIAGITDNDTTYSAGQGLQLNGTSFTAKAGDHISVNDNGINVTVDGTVTENDTGIVSGGTVYTAVNAEKTARESADTTLQTNIDNEVTARETAVSGEATVRANADTILQGNIDTLSNIAVKYDSVDTKDKVTLVGTNGTTIDNVKDATLSATSKEAVTGSQLFATNTNLATEVINRTNADTALSDRIGTVSTDGNYIKASSSKNIAENLAILDAQIRANSNTINGNKTHFFGVNSTDSTNSNYDGAGATGGNAVAIGVSSSAAGNNAISIGNSIAGNINSIAIGSQANASVANYDQQGHTIAVGTLANALKDGAIAIGKQTVAFNDNAVAIGVGSQATGGASLALGQSAKSAGSQAVALGHSANASGDYSTSLGFNSSASDNHSLALGDWAKSKAIEATAIGYSAEAEKSSSTAIGASAKATNVETTAIGENSRAAGYGATALGVSTWAIGDYSTSLGYSITNNSDYAVSIGYAIINTSDNSVSVGRATSVSSPDSIALGSFSRADEANVLSIGKDAVGIEGQEGYVPELTRKIQHVTAGVNDTDAVNVSQLTSSLDDKADTDLGNITSDGEDVVRALAKDSVNVVGDGKASVSKSDVAGVDTYTVSVTANGTVTENNSDIVTGGTVYNALQQTVSDVNDALDLKANKDASNVSANTAQWGSAIGTGTVAENNGELVTGGTVYTALQTQNTATQTALDGKANVALNNVTDAGHTVIKSDAKQAINVVGGTYATVAKTDVSGVDTYTVNVATDGSVVSGNNKLVTGDTVYQAIQDAITGSETGTGTALEGKANVDASNVTDATTWGTKIATGTVAENDVKAVSGGTVYTELRPADGNYVAQANTTAQNLTALDTQVKANADAIVSNKTHYFGVNTDNEWDMNYNGGGAEGSNAIAVGSNAWASGDDSIAIGTMSGTYTGKQATAVGYISSAIADKATAVGNMSQAVNVSSVAVGDMAAASGQYSTAIGAYSHAKAKNSIAIGSDSYAETEDEVSFGRAAIEANPDIGQIAHDEIKRRLTHVDTGVNDTDAVNVKQLTDAADTKGNVGLDNITTAGHNVIKADAKEAINVTGSGKATVAKSDVSGVDTYNVEVLGNGTVANGNENLVTGGTVYQAIQDAITGSEAGTGTELAGKANKDASNVADNTADWGTAIGTGVVAKNNGELVTGGTVYVAINNEATTRANADTALSDRIGTVSTDRNYIKASTDKNVSENLGLLDTAVKTNADAISALTDGKANISLNNINADGETVVKNLAKDAVKVVAGTKTTVTEGTDGDAKTYAVNVATDGAVAQNNEGIVTGGTVYNALQQQQLNTQTELVGKANVALDNITTAGHNVIKEDAKSVINVIGDGNASVDKSTVAGVDTYKVSVTANGAVAENNADIVSGGTVYQAIQNAITGSETGTGTALEGKANVSLDNLNDAGNTVIQQKAIASVKVVNGENTTVTSEIDTDGNKTYKVKTNATGAVANGNESIVSGGTMFTELRPADGNYIAQANTTAQNLTALDTQVKTNTDTISTHTTDITNLKDLSNITEAGQNVIKESAQGSVNVTGTGLANVTKATMGGVDTYTVNVVADGAVASDDAKAVSGATVYGETRVARDGNYVMAGNAANGNIMALDDALKTVSDAVNDGLDGKADTALNNISADGQTVIRDLAKGSVKVVNGTHTTVTEGADGEAKTYAVDVAANGAVADGDTGIVTGNTVYQAIQDAIAGSETGTGTALSGKANVDASNVTDAAAWGVKIATGAVAENDTKAVSGGTVYAALENAKTELNTSITNGLAGKTNVALDNISEAGEGVIKTLAKSSVNLTGSGKASVTKSDVSGVDTYTVNVTADGTVADGDSDIVSGGTVYAALQATQTALQGNIDNKANAGLDNISADGTNVVRTIAKTAVAVADGENTTVSSETDADGNISYKVKANATGTVADGNTGLVDGGSVYAAIQDAVGTSETGTAAGLAGKADVDASNVTDSAAWAGKLGTGAVADGNAELVTGGVVYDALNTAQTALQSNIDGKSSKDLSDITTAGENKVKSLAQNAVRVVAGQHTGVTISASNGALTYAVDVDASGAVEENNAKIVTGGAVYNAVKAEETARANADNALGARIGALAADGNYVRQSDNVSQNLTHLDTQVKANKDALDALSAFDSENAVMYDSAAKDEVTFAGAAGTVLKNVADGTLAENSKEAVNGGQLFAVRQDVAANQDAITALNGLVGTVTDGNYIDSAQSVGVNLGILDARIKSNADRAQANAEAVDALRDLSSLTEAGQGVIAGIAKDAVRVTAGSHVSVTKNTSANESEFVVSVNANGQVADGNTGIVTGGIVKTALDDAKTELQDAIAAMGAGADANAVHYDDDAKTSVSLGDGTAPVALKNIADGSVEENSRDAVTGGQLWQTNQAVANETAAREEAVQGLSDRIGTVDRDGGVISKDKNVSENLTALDAQVKTNTDALAEIRTVAGEAKEVANNKADKDLSGLSDAGKSVVKNIAKEATDVVSSDGSVEIVKSAGAEQNVYQLSVKKDGKVEAGNEDIVTGGVVYDAIKDLKAGSDTFYFGVNNTDENDRNRTGDGASGANAVAVGANVLARGDESVAVGHGSEANGLQSIAIGTGNVVNGDHSGAIGDPNTVNGSGSYVVGNDNTVDGNNTFVMGNNVNAAGSNSVVLGANSDGSQDNVVSVGSVGNERKIVHVADGDIAQDSHDAVTGGQLFNVRKDLQDAQGIDAQKWAEALGTGTVAQGDGNLVTGDTVFTAIRNVNTNNGIIVPDAANNEIRIGGDAAHDGIDYVNIAKSDGSGRVMTGVITDPQDMNSAANVGYVNAIGQNIVNGVSQGFRKMDDKINKVGAGAAAMASLAPLPFDEDQKWNISAAVGTFRGETAGAVGVFYKPQDNVMLNVRGSFGNSENMAGAGVTIGLNKGPAKGLSKVAMAKAMNAQATEIMNQKQQIASQQEQLEAQKAEIAELKKLVQEVVARKR